MTGAEALSQAIRSHPWLYPAAETVHLWGMALVAGSAILFDLRVLGVSRGATVPAAARLLLPFSLLGLLLVVPAGMTLFAADPFATLANAGFRLKMLLLCAAAANAVAFHLGPAGAALKPDAAAVPGIARAQSALSLLLWLGIIAAGRSIAYV